MNRRALAIALVVALLGVALVAVYLRRFEQEASGGEPVELITALKPIEAGTLITDDMLATRLVPRAYVEDRAILARDKPKIIGLRMGQSLQAQQTVMWTDLAIAMEERRNLSSLVQPGMRAVSITAAQRADKAYALIHPGDRIDIIATMSQPGPTGMPADKEAKAAIVLLQNVLVLAVGIDTGGEQTESSNNEKELLISVSITVPEAQLLALAQEKGKLSVALRNPDDLRVTEGITDMSSAALVDVQARRQAAGGGAAKPTGPVKIESTGK